MSSPILSPSVNQKGFFFVLFTMVFCQRCISKLFFLLFLAFLLHASSAAAQTDSLYRVFKPDSSLTGIQRYNNHYSLGDNGVTFVPLFYNYQVQSPNFHFAANNTPSVVFTPENLNFLDTHKPFTELVLLAGAKNEVVSKFIHSQNVNKNLNVTLNFQRLRSDGFYQRQASVVTDFSAAVYYHTTDYHYILLSGIILNRVQTDVNGGIPKDSAFQNGPLQDRTLLAINLNNANRQYSTNEFFLKHFYSKGVHHPDGDTNMTHYTKPSDVWIHTLHLSETKIAFYDSAYYNENPTGPLWPAAAYDSVRTSDLTRIINFSNQLGYEHRPQKKDGSPRQIGLGFGINQEMVLLNQHIAKDTTIGYTDFQAQPNIYTKVINNWGLYGKIVNFNAAAYQFQLQGEATVVGYNQGDYAIRYQSRYRLPDSSSAIHLDAGYNNIHPDFMWSTYYSNYYNWQNQLQNTQNAYVNLYYWSPRYRLQVGGGMFSTAHMVYFDGTGVRQDPGQFHGATLYLKKSVTIRHWGFSTKLVGQYVPDSAALRLPAFVTETSLFYENWLFKKALQMQIGVDLFYNSAYFANGYIPALGQYYVQNEKALGSYPYFDVFLNARISRARIFIKYENVNAYLGNFSYFYALHYPYPDAALKLGVIWRFFD